MSKQFWGVIAVIFLIFIGIFLFSGDKTEAPGKADKAALTKHVQGKGQAGVTLVEYGDYQCPFCAQYHPVLKQVQAEFNDQIYFQFRNFPLSGKHPNAFAGARAAEAAGLQGKFWEMHDLLYENQQQWSSANDPAPFFKQYAKSLSLNEAQFTKDFASSKVNDLINADLAEGTKLGAEGTPAFFLDGKKVTIGQSAAAFEKVIKEAIAKKSPAATPNTSSTSPAPAAPAQ